MKPNLAFAVITSLVAAAIAAPALAQDSAPAPYTPASAWSLDYGDDYCRLARSFSDGAGGEVPGGEAALEVRVDALAQLAQEPVAAVEFHLG